MSGFMETFTGRKVRPLQDIVVSPIHEIAHVLSHICRYNGHCHRFYSVMEHSCHIHDWLLKETYDTSIAKQGLFHDAPEVILQDLIRPIKGVIAVNTEVYTEATDKLWAAYCKRYGMAQALHHSVVEADNRILLDERRALFPESRLNWLVEGDPLGVAIKAWSPERATIEGLRRLKEYAI